MRQAVRALPQPARRERRAALMGRYRAELRLSSSPSALLFRWAGRHTVAGGSITLGTVYIIFAYTELLRRPIDQITRQLQDLQQAGASINRIGELMQERSTHPRWQWACPVQGALSVQFEGVTFGYNPRSLC